MLSRMPYSNLPERRGAGQNGAGKAMKKSNEPIQLMECTKKEYEIQYCRPDPGTIVINYLEQPEYAKALQNFEETHPDFCQKLESILKEQGLSHVVQMPGLYLPPKAVDLIGRYDSLVGLGIRKAAEDRKIYCITGEKGRANVLLIGTRGEMWPVREEKFAKTYRTVNEHTCRTVPGNVLYGVRFREEELSGFPVSGLMLNASSVGHGKGDYVMMAVERSQAEELFGMSKAEFIQVLRDAEKGRGPLSETDRWVVNGTIADDTYISKLFVAERTHTAGLDEKRETEENSGEQGRESAGNPKTGRSDTKDDNMQKGAAEGFFDKIVQMIHTDAKVEDIELLKPGVKVFENRQEYYDSITDMISAMEKYYNAVIDFVITGEKAKEFTGDQREVMITSADSKRSYEHNAAMAQITAMNRVCRAIGMEPLSPDFGQDRGLANRFIFDALNDIYRHDPIYWRHDPEKNIDNSYPRLKDGK